MLFKHRATSSWPTEFHLLLPRTMPGLQGIQVQPRVRIWILCRSNRKKRSPRFRLVSYVRDQGKNVSILSGSLLVDALGLPRLLSYCVGGAGTNCPRLDDSGGRMWNLLSCLHCKCPPREMQYCRDAGNFLVAVTRTSNICW